MIFRLGQFGLDQDKFKAAVRENSRVLVTDLNVVTENIVRLWNRCKHTVHSYRELQDYFLFRTSKKGFSSEGKVLDDLQEIYDTNGAIRFDLIAELIDLKSP